MTEKEIIKAELKRRREEARLLKKIQKEKEKEERAIKSAKTEADLVCEYAEKVIKGKVAQGWIDNRVTDLFEGKKVNKNLWLDTDFFFSVVFQSAEQKYEFLKKMNFKVEQDYDGTQVQIVNGLELAKDMGIELTLEKASDYPLGNVELLPMVLDYEYIERE